MAKIQDLNSEKQKGAWGNHHERSSGYHNGSSEYGGCAKNRIICQRERRDTRVFAMTVNAGKK